MASRRAASGKKMYLVVRRGWMKSAIIQDASNFRMQVNLTHALCELGARGKLPKPSSHGWLVGAA